MKLTPVLVPLEAWFWYMLFLDLLSAKPCLGFLIELKVTGSDFLFPFFRFLYEVYIKIKQKIVFPSEKS